MLDLDDTSSLELRCRDLPGSISGLQAPDSMVWRLLGGLGPTWRRDLTLSLKPKPSSSGLGTSFSDLLTSSYNPGSAICQPPSK